MTSRYTRGVLGRPLDTFYWALKVHGHCFCLVWEVALSTFLVGTNLEPTIVEAPKTIRVLFPFLQNVCYFISVL